MISEMASQLLTAERYLRDAKWGIGVPGYTAVIPHIHSIDFTIMHHVNLLFRYT